MNRHGLAVKADQGQAQQYTSSSTASNGDSDANFYHETNPSDASLDQIDPQLAAAEVDQMQTDVARGEQLDDSITSVDAEANVQALAAAVGSGDAHEDEDSVNIARLAAASHDDSYPELHLRALKSEDDQQHSISSSNIRTFHVGASGNQDSDENIMYAHSAMTHVQQAPTAQVEVPDEQHQQNHLNQTGGRAPVSVEELQLAAQLSQGLAPMMREANARREGEYHDVNGGDTDTDGDGGLQAAEDEAEAFRVAAVAAAAAADGAYNGPDIATAYHHDLQHADVQGHGDYTDASQAVGHLSPSLHMAHLAGQHAYTNADQVPPRKRSKVSRACDACRRKKVKCDAISETEQCTNCRRAQTECLFSRVPQKRGPSKGYIKELADRINSIEGKLGSHSPSSAADTPELLGRSGIDRHGSVHTRYLLNENAKRPYANMSDDNPDGNPVSISRVSAWSTAKPRASVAPPYSAVSLAPQPRLDAEAPNMQSQALSALERILPLVDYESQELDNFVFESYLTAVHPCLPFLPSDRSCLLETLTDCPRFLQDALVVALRAVANALTSTAPTGLARVANALLAQWEIDGGPRTSLHNLVHLQTLLLLAIEADTHGPAALKGHHGGPSKTALLSRAVAVAYEMDLPKEQLGATVAEISSAAAKSTQINTTGADASAQSDTEAHLALRAWWSLVVLDRWNAIALGKALLIPFHTVVLSPGLRSLLGEPAFQFTKLSYLLGSSIAPSLASPDPLRQLQLSSSLTSFLVPLNQQLDLGLEMWRADLPDAITESAAPLVHLGYWQYRLLAYLLQPSALASDVAWATKKLVELIVVITDAKTERDGTIPPPPITPFHHYFICLSGLILAELSKIADERQAALCVFNELLEVVAPQPVPVVNDAEGATETVNNSVWNYPLRETLARRLQSSHYNSGNSSAKRNAASVAAAAVAAVAKATAAAPAATKYMEDDFLRIAGNYENLGFNPLALLSSGFLNTVQRSPAAVVSATAGRTSPETTADVEPTTQKAVAT